VSCITRCSRFSGRREKFPSTDETEMCHRHRNKKGIIVILSLIDSGKSFEPAAPINQIIHLTG
jgi:hypothetical protein